MQDDRDAFHRLCVYNKAQYEPGNFPDTSLMPGEMVSFAYEYVS